MTALVPRLWSDMADWFDLDVTARAGLIRLEDNLTDPGPRWAGPKVPRSDRPQTLPPPRLR